MKSSISETHTFATATEPAGGGGAFVGISFDVERGFGRKHVEKSIGRLVVDEKWPGQKGPKRKITSKMNRLT